MQQHNGNFLIHSPRGELTESTASTKEFDNPTYGTSDTLPTRQGNGENKEYEGLTYDIANPKPSITDGLVYDTPDYNDRGPEGPIQSRPRENVDMSNVEEYGKLRR